MMKKILLVITLLIVLKINSQKSQTFNFSYKNFENEILDFKPIKTKDLSKENYQEALFKLDETKSAVENSPNKFCYADYWNIAMAFVNLEEKKENIEIAFKKAINDDPKTICEVINKLGYCQLDIRIPETFFDFIGNCSNNYNVASFDIDKYANKNKLDISLVKLINQIQKSDAEYRKHKPIDWSQQKILDKIILKKIDSLYIKKGKYIGKSLVGNKYASVMWSIIQHADIKIMERYLPIIKEAVDNNELSKVPLKMLLDRYYGLKHGYQFFGTQSGFGFTLADKKTKNKILTKYNL